MKYFAIFVWVALGVLGWHGYDTTRECEAKGGVLVSSTFSLATCIKAEVIK